MIINYIFEIKIMKYNIYLKTKLDRWEQMNKTYLPNDKKLLEKNYFSIGKIDYNLLSGRNNKTWLIKLDW